MMTRYTLGWYGAEGVAWNKILDSIATLAAKLAKSVADGGWGAEVTREHWDAPRLDLRWYTDDGIGRAVQVLIEGIPEHYHLRVSGSAWKDFDKDQKRQCRGQELKRIPVPLDPDQLEIGVVEEALCSARVIISKWVEADLTEKSDLPQRDPKLTGAFVQGRNIPLKFAVTLERDEDGFIIASCPALPGCHSQGRTHDEALANIKEAVHGYLASMREHGEPIPIEEVQEIEVAV